MGYILCIRYLPCIGYKWVKIKITPFFKMLEDAGCKYKLDFVESKIVKKSQNSKMLEL